MKKDLARAGYIQDGDSPLCNKILNKFSNLFQNFNFSNGSGSEIIIKEKNVSKLNKETKKLNGHKKVKVVMFLTNSKS